MKSKSGVILSEYLKWEEKDHFVLNDSHPSFQFLGRTMNDGSTCECVSGTFIVLSTRRNTSNGLHIGNRLTMVSLIFEHMRAR